MTSERLPGYIAYGFAFIMLGFITIAVPIGYMIGEYIEHGGPYMVSWSLVGSLLLVGFLIMFALYNYLEIWLEETSA